MKESKFAHKTHYIFSHVTTLKLKSLRRFLAIVSRTFSVVRFCISTG